MPASKHRFLGFRASCLTVCVLCVLFAGKMLVSGVSDSMRSFGVPELVLASPHYQDAMLWVFSHMLMLGLVVGALGLVTESARGMLWASRLLSVVFACFMYLDVRTADSFLGNRLYLGSASNFPSFVDLFFVALFVRHSIRPEAEQSMIDSPK